MNYYNYFVTIKSQQYCIQKVISKLKTTFQNKKRTAEKKKFYINKKKLFNERFYHIYVLQGHG